jgi:integrase
MPPLQQKKLEALRAGESGKTLRDGGNLFGRVRVKRNGAIAVSFYYRYRFDGKLKDFSCGTWPADTLKQIRANRDAAKLHVKQGADPSVQKKVVKQEERDATLAKLAEIARQKNESLTVQDLFDVWAMDGVRRADGNAELTRSFNADVLPKIGTKLIKELTERDLRGVLRVLVARGVNRTAAVVRNNLTQMFAWAERRQPWRKLLAEGNPMDLIEIDKIVNPAYDLNNQRDRILSAEEVRELQRSFHQLQDAYESAPNKRIVAQPIEKTTQCAIWIMLATLCRVGETSQARWEQVNFETGEWVIPKENVKGRTSELRVYLSPFALDQFRQLHALTGHSDWCFPARNKEGHVCVKSISKQVGDRQAMFKKGRDGTPRKPMKHRRSDNTLVLGEGKNGAWTPHDLRRTGATMMQRLGVALDIIDRCQNHVLAGSKVRRHYLHHDYAEEKRAAWRLLGEELARVLGAAGNVVHFQRKV